MPYTDEQYNEALRQAAAERQALQVATQADFNNREPAHDYLVQIREKIKEDGLTPKQTLDAIKVILVAYSTAKRARRRAELEAEAAIVAAELLTLDAPEP